MTKMFRNVPQPYARLRERFTEMASAYDAMGKAAYELGSLSNSECRLVKLALAAGAGLEGAVHSHTRRALDEGIDPEKLYQVVALASTTLGMPATVRTFTWIEDVLAADGPDGGRAEDLDE